MRLLFHFSDRDHFHSQGAPQGEVCGCSTLSPAWTYLLPRGCQSNDGPCVEGWVFRRKWQASLLSRVRWFLLERSVSLLGVFLPSQNSQVLLPVSQLFIILFWEYCPIIMNHYIGPPCHWHVHDGKDKKLPIKLNKMNVPYLVYFQNGYELWTLFS